MRFTIYIIAMILVLSSSRGEDVLPERIDAASKVANTDGSYTIMKKDMISVSVYDEPDLAIQARVDGMGGIKLPLLGNVSIAGKTVREAEKLLEDLFIKERFLRNPAVTISVVSYSPREVIVLGAVGRAGPLALPQEYNSIDIVELVARFGGFSGIAKSSAVSIKRELAEGTIREFTVDVESLIEDSQNGKKRVGFEVLPGDIIYVPERIF